MLHVGVVDDDAIILLSSSRKNQFLRLRAGGLGAW